MKFCQQLPGWFSLRTSHKVLIWCTNHPNVHIHTFWKHWTFIWGYFFPVSILNGFYGAREFYRMTGCKELLKFVSRIFFIKTSYRENRSLFMNQKLCWGFNSPDWCIAFDYILILSVVEINFLWFMAILKYIICRCNDTELPRLVTVFFIRCYFEISYSSR